MYMADIISFKIYNYICQGSQGVSFWPPPPFTDMSTTIWFFDTFP